MDVQPTHGLRPPLQRRAPTEAEVRALASAVRLRIIRLCIDRPLSNRELAERLQLNPATTLHHVRKLVEAGFLVAEPVRRGKRGSREVPYRSTGKSWTLDVRDSGQPSPATAMLEAYLQEIALVDVDQTFQVRLGMRLTEQEHAELVARLQALLDEFSDRQSADGPAYSLYVNLHPDVTRDGPG